MRLSRKLGGVIILLLLPVVLLLTLLVIEAGKSIDYAKIEHKGIEYIQPVTGLLESVAKHRDLVHALYNGSDSVSDAIKTAQESVTNAVESELSDSTVTVAEQAGEKITQLVPQIRKTSELIHEISAASSEQDVGTNEISQSLRVLEQTVQQTSKAAVALTGYADGLSGQVSQQRQAMSCFKLTPAPEATPGLRKAS